MSAKVHISSYSGSIAEAALCNVPLNITFSEIGAKTFAELISKRQLQFHQFKRGESLIDLIENQKIEFNVPNVQNKLNFQIILNDLNSRIIKGC